MISNKNINIHANLIKCGKTKNKNLDLVVRVLII